MEHGPRVALTPFYHASAEDVDVGDVGACSQACRCPAHLTSAQVFPPFKSKDVVG